MLEAFGQALQYFSTLGAWIVIILATIISLVFGIIPGLNGIVAMALFIPFCFFLPGDISMPFLLCLCATAGTGGSVTAILLNIPGTESSAASVLDGYPMTQKGQAGRAIGACLMSSISGSGLTIVWALIMIPVVLPIVMAVGSPEMVFVILAGIAFIGALSKGKMMKGVISGFLGLLLALVGSQVVTGVTRFTFDTAYLSDGIPLVPLMLGLFGVPSAMALAARGSSYAERGTAFKELSDVREGMKDVFRHWGLWIRSSFVGYIIGIIPGIGASSAVFIAYGQAKVTSKHPEQFGKGTVEGIIAPESASNAKEAGALLTTVALGIPGSTAMAVLLAGLLIIGITPGPSMLKDHLDLSLILFLTLLVANIMGMLILLAGVRYILKIVYVPAPIIFPLIIAIAFAGSYVFRCQLLDILVVIVFAALGIVMKKWGYNIPAFLLGFILGELFEKYVYVSLNAYGPLFFMRPISLVLIALIITLFVYSPIKGLFTRKKSDLKT